MPRKTIAELAAREQELKDELTQVRAEIAARAGEVDPPKGRRRAVGTKLRTND